MHRKQYGIAIYNNGSKNIQAIRVGCESTVTEFTFKNGKLVEVEYVLGLS